MGSQYPWQITGTLLCLGLLLPALVTGCREDRRVDKSRPKQAVSTNKYGGVYRKALQSEPVTLDPAFAENIYAVSVVQQVFDGLVQFDADLNVIPGIAWSWSASRDGLVWTFQVRQGVKFHHGREVTAHDVVYSFTRLLDPQSKSPHTGLFERVRGAKEFLAGEAHQVEGLRALDDFTMQITLSQPYTPFITTLGMAQPRIVPREEVDRLGAQFGQQPVGTGPFRFVRWVPGEEIILEANTAYFEGRPFLDRLEYHIFPATQPLASLARFEAGQLEDISVIDQERQRLLDNPRYRFVRKPTLTTLLLWMNTQDAPLHDLRVRQAINYAINRQAINSTIRQNRFVLAQGVLPPGMPGYNPEIAGYAYNPTRAKALLADAGYPDGTGFPPLELWSNAPVKTALAEHEAIKHDLQQIGIPVELFTTDNWKQFTEILGKRPRALYRYAWYADFPDPDTVLFALFHSQGPSNIGQYNNPEVDRLLEQAQRETDDFQRLQVYRQAEAVIMDDAPTVNLVYYTFEHLFQPYVNGIELNALGERHIPMKKIWLDKAHHAFPKAHKSE